MVEAETGGDALSRQFSPSSSTALSSAVGFVRRARYPVAPLTRLFLTATFGARCSRVRLLLVAHDHFLRRSDQRGEGVGIQGLGFFCRDPWSRGSTRAGSGLAVGVMATAQPFVILVLDDLWSNPLSAQSRSSWMRGGVVDGRLVG